MLRGAHRAHCARRVSANRPGNYDQSSYRLDYGGGSIAAGQHNLAALLNIHASAARAVILSSLVLISLCTAVLLRSRYHDQNP